MGSRLINHWIIGYFEAWMDRWMFKAAEDEHIFDCASVFSRQVMDHKIPAKTSVMINYYAIFRDPRHWEQPEKFWPERFLHSDGSKHKLRPKSFTPFSIGPRNCVGEWALGTLGTVHL